MSATPAPPAHTAPAAPAAVNSLDVPVRARASLYPAPFAARVAGRSKRVLGELFGLSNFGVNLVTLAPGALSSLRHAHTRQDEFVYVLQGHPVLLTDAGRSQLGPGMCAGFAAATGNAHCLVNETEEVVLYLEVGDRSPGDTATYPDDDLEAVLVDSRWEYRHKDGQPYP